ncbi:acyltransferase family protein [Lysinibacillus fusiformis]|uniref:acyltransferase family protein n=1 Tax=Lysinibacillus fusiformis TaxID=28031 RepID=UPI00187ED047|nr:acyltransferase [Lysinibacillus fusiformis]MBD8522336.1 acyltransferase [Lysinibacillus fusiformis]
MGKLYYFEGIRGIAAFVVLISHFIQIFYPGLFSTDVNLMHHGLEEGISETPLNLFYNGNFAVCIFFVLSGFVLSYKFFVKKDKEILVESAVKRYFRLAIPVITSLLLAFIFLKLNWYYYGKIIFETRATMPDFYSETVTFLQIIKEGLYSTFFENTTSLNPVLWTMYYELLGSFIVFGFLALFGNSKNRYLFYGVLLITFWNSYFIAFILGMILCDLIVNTNMLKILKQKLIVFLFLIIGLFLGSYPYVNPMGTVYEFLVINPSSTFNYFMFYHIVGSVLLLIAVLGSDILQKFLSIKPFIFLGNISFSLYLIHFIILCSFSSYLFMRLLDGGLPYNLSFLIMAFPSIIIIFALSYIMHKLIDSKSVDISKKVYEKYFKNS